MKKILRFLTSRLFIVGLLLAVQIIVFFLLLFYFADTYYLTEIFTLCSILVAVYLFSTPSNPVFKIAWLIPILLLPVFAIPLYFLFGNYRMSTKLKKQTKCIHEKTMHMFQTEGVEALMALKEEDAFAYRQACYLARTGLAPTYQNTQTCFLATGEEKFEVMVEELKKAKQYIFLEYFIIEAGLMWDTVLEILIAKVREGVDVRILFDDLGCINTLPSDFAKKLRAVGIQVQTFNPFRPSLDVFMNYRDHRKICVIDGVVGLTGGINLADEYINAYEKHGHWKDAAIMLKGDAVWSFTVLFLQMWQLVSGDDSIHYLSYRPTARKDSDGFVLPFGDTPLDDIPVAENTYMSIIQNAKRYVYITTPYLILDHEMIRALIAAADSGIDVRIVTPHIADKKVVHSVTRFHYGALLKHGVKIYEYTPGFIHAKTIVSDDAYAMVGTANFDFRSFYLHFECGVFLYRSQAVGQLLQDDLTLFSQCEEIQYEDYRKTPLHTRIWRGILMVFSPFM